MNTIGFYFLLEPKLCLMIATKTITLSDVVLNGYRENFKDNYFINEEG